MSDRGRSIFGALGRIGMQIAATAAVVALSQWLMNIINNKITFRVTREVRQKAFAHLQTLPLSPIWMRTRRARLSAV